MNARAFTLIELIIAISIIAIMAVAAIPAMSAVTGANARASAGEVAGATRWLFDTASLRHVTCRLAMDLDAQAWWAECTHDKFLANREGEKSRDGAAEAEEDDDEALKKRFPDERDAEKRKLLAKAHFGEFTDQIVGKKELPSGAAFVDVWTQHQKEPYTKGLAYLYFFPQGMVEAAQIPITDGSNVYTIVTQPLTGHAKVVNGKPRGER